MKQVSNRYLGFCAAIVLIAGSNLARADKAAPSPQVLPVVYQSSDDKGSFCLDSMETVPFADELEPTPISLDAGCAVLEGTIAT